MSGDRHDRGAALVAVLVALAVAGAVVAVLLGATSSQVRGLTRAAAGQVEGDAAEGGVDVGIEVLRATDAPCPAGPEAWSDPLAVPDLGGLEVEVTCRELDPHPSTPGRHVLVRARAGAATALAEVVVDPGPDRTVTVAARQSGA